MPRCMGCAQDRPGDDFNPAWSRCRVCVNKSQERALSNYILAMSEQVVETAPDGGAPLAAHLDMNGFPARWAHPSDQKGRRDLLAANAHGGARDSPDSLTMAHTLPTCRDSLVGARRWGLIKSRRSWRKDRAAWFGPIENWVRPASRQIVKRHPRPRLQAARKPTEAHVSDAERGEVGRLPAVGELFWVDTWIYADADKKPRRPLVVVQAPRDWLQRVQ